MNNPRYTIFTDPFEEEYLVSTVMRNNELCRKSKSEFRNREVPCFELAMLEYNPSGSFGGLFDKETLYKHTLHPIGILFNRARYTNMTFIPRGNLRICTQCVIDDVENLGTAYFHRTHVAPGVLGTLVCHLHAVPLSDFCPTCQVELKHHRLNQLSVCINRKANIKTEYILGSTRQQYSQFVYEILKRTNLEKYRCLSIQTIGNTLEKQGYPSPSIDSYFQFCIDTDNKTGTPTEVYEKARRSNHNLACTPMQLFTRTAYLLYENLDNFINEIEKIRSVRT
ncbi:hypothetical protein D3C71_588460 [compost metagenome]